MHTHTLDAPTPKTRESVIHRLPAAAKFCVVLTFIAFSLLCPRADLIYLLIPAACLILIAALSRVHPWTLLKRLVLYEYFVLGAGVMVLLQPDGWMLLRILVMRCTLCLATMILFTTTTPFGDILRLFRQLYMPRLLVTTLALMHRYLFVLSDESARMRRARACRTFSPRKRMAWRTLSTVIGQLFIRASDRAQRIYDAMRARGWEETP